MLHPTRFAFVADSLQSGKFPFAPLLALLLGAAGCAATVPAGAPRSTPPPADGAGQVKPSDDVEATVLKRLDGWPAGQAWAVGGVSVTAEAALCASACSDVAITATSTPNVSNPLHIVSLLTI